MQLYLDASCIIYLTEARGPRSKWAKDRILRHLAQPAARLITSRLSRLECRMRPLRDNALDVLAEYDDFFTADRVDLADVTAAVIERATGLRAKYGVKTIDALHLATAIEYRVEAAVTGDQVWARCTELPVEIVAAAG